MAKKTIKTVFQLRRAKTADWELNKDIIPAAGEPCYDLDLKTLRIGDGETTYENLPVIGSVESGGTGDVQSELETIKSLIEALQEDVDNVEENVDNMKEQVGETNIIEIHENVTYITESVNNLATQVENTTTEIVTIQETLETKADAETVTELQTVIEQKVDVETVETLRVDLQTYVDEQIQNAGSGNIDDGEI